MQRLKALWVTCTLVAPDQVLAPRERDVRHAADAHGPALLERERAATSDGPVGSGATLGGGRLAGILRASLGRRASQSRPSETPA
jgi:hypothetical protein